MNIPNLPTDNLYKFISMTGVLLMFVCVAVLEYRISQQVELNTEISLGKKAFEFLERDLERTSKGLDSILQSLEEAEKRGEKIDSNKLEHFSSLKKGHEELKARVRNIDREIMTLRKKSDFAENYYQRTLRIKPLLLFGGFTGIALAFIGFYLWYHRLQKHQDMLLKMQAISAAQQVAQADAEDSAA